MGRGPKPAKSKESKPPARKSPKDADSRVRDLEKQLAAALGQLQTRNRELAAAQEQQTATSEILRVISSSPTDVQPVFDAIAASAARLCDAYDVIILRLDGDVLRKVAHHGPIPAPPIPFFPPTRDTVGGRTLIDRRPIHVADLQAETVEFPVGSVSARRLGARTVLGVPLVREGEAIGVIYIRRTEVQPFTDKQIALTQTFADQAVIAIENVRLFTELQEKNQALVVAHAQITETLEQQTATAEILRVIASSPTDLDPVLEAVARNAAQLCGADDVAIIRAEEDGHTILYSLGPDVTLRGRKLRGFRTATARAIREVRTVHVPDLLADPDIELRPEVQPFGWRTGLAVPLVRGGIALGSITARRSEVRPFSDQQIKLLETFADQAVIAIQNVRLFKELESSNRELRVALEQQTATSEILRTIAHSQTDVQPVFDTIVHSAVRLLRGYSGTLTRVAGDQIELAAFTGTDVDADAALRASYPRSLESEEFPVMTIRERVPINVAAAQNDPRLPLARARGFHSVTVVPLLRHDDAVGAIMVTRSEPGGFTNAEITLLQTFADQAVIAIENARLFRELQQRTGELTRSVEKLTALGEISQAVSSTLDLEMVLDTITDRARQLAGADGGAIYEYDELTEQFHLRATRNVDAALIGALRAVPFRRGEGVMGRATETREPIQIGDIAAPGVYDSHIRDVLIAAGYRALLSVPILREGQIIGSLSLNRKAPGEFSAEVIDVLKNFATQSALAIQNARLFREIADKSRQLEIASQHKSEFLANMSHELRTPLNAIIGFSEVLSERMFGELNEKQEEYLNDIYASGTHLLSLINDILDLSKIEAGRMELDLSDFDLPTALDNALMLVRERAGRRGIALQMNVDSRFGQLRADERKVRQVVLNLLSNAIKFTPEGGRIEVAALPKDGHVEVSVSDTGVGIAPEDLEAVFEEFRQVGTAEKKAEGTGLGLTLCRKFIELHGGKIRVKSAVGQGSTFTFTIPVGPAD